MSFEKWENDLFDAYYGKYSDYEPDEDCPCGCEGVVEECTFDPEAYDEEMRAEARLADYEAEMYGGGGWDDW